MFLTAVGLIALLAVASGAPKEALPKPDGRIIGGQAVNIVDYPYQLSLLWYGTHWCGATLISNKYAITAVHCVEDVIISSSLSVLAGSTSTTNKTAGIERQVLAVHPHPAYTQWNADYDLAILELREEMPFREDIVPITLPYHNQHVKDGTAAVVSGWGSVREGGDLSEGQLYAVEVKMVGNDACNEAYSEVARLVSDRMVCAGVEMGGKDACNGDSGGPLVVDGELIGVVSWGFGCARPGYPGVYSSVPAMRDYIQKITNI